MSQAVVDQKEETSGIHSGAIGGRWQLQNRIGVQPHATVYQALDLIQERQVELELLRAELFDTLTYSAINEFVETHFTPVCGLQHRTIDSCLSFGIHEGLPYLVYERSSKFTLRSLLTEQSKLPLATVKIIAEHLLLALSTAHRSGIRHLGLAPERILLTVDSVSAKVAMIRGFGVASGLSTRLSNLNLMTRTGTTIAPPRYMSPELFAGSIADERADMYSLGAVLYEMLCGRPPFTADSNIDLLLALRSEAIAPISQYRPEHAEDPFLNFVERLLLKSVHSRPFSASICLAGLRGGSEPVRRQEQFLRDENVPRLETREIEQPLRRRREAPTKLSAGRTWVAPVLLAAVVLNGVMALLLVRSNFREREVTQLVQIEEGREAARARLALMGEGVSDPRGQGEAEEVGPDTSMRGRELVDLQQPLEVEDPTTVREMISSGSSTTSKKTQPAKRGAATATSKQTQQPAPAEVSKAEDFISRRVEALGVTVRRVDEEFIQRNGLLDADGLLVEAAEPDGPAYQAGLRKDDILQFTETAGKSILSWTPERLIDPAELEEAVARSQESDTRLALIIKRGSYDGLVVFVRNFIE